MNKEIIVAVAIGVLLGLGGAVFLNSRKNPSLNTSSFGASKRVEVVTKPKNELTVRFDKLPAIDTIATSGELKIQGFSHGYNALVIANGAAIKPLHLKKSGPFSLTSELKPGFNRILLNAHVGKTTQVKIITMFYLKPKAAVLPIEPENKEEQKKDATNEASILKQKLEKKVLELRNQARKAVYGAVKSINEKEMSVMSSGATVKVSLEPEITRFYQVDGVGLVEKKFEDVKKDDTVTAFISQIGDEEKSYTVYIQDNSQLLAGKVSNIDTSEYKVTMVNFDKTTHEVDVENSSVQKVYDMKQDTTERFGFSKLKVGDYIYAIVSIGRTKNDFFEEYLTIKIN